MKNVCIFLLLIITSKSYSQSSNVITLIDKDLFIINESQNQHYSNSYEFNSWVQQRIIDEVHEKFGISGNIFSYYAIQKSGNNFKVKTIKSLLTSSVFSLNTSALKNLYNEPIMNDMLDLLSFFNNELKTSTYHNNYFDKTYILIFSNNNFISNLPTRDNTILNFSNNTVFSGNDQFEYTYEILEDTLVYDEESEEWISEELYKPITEEKSINWTSFELGKKPGYENIFSPLEIENNSLVLNFNRVTVPGKNAIRLFPLSEKDSNLKVRLVGDSKIEIFEYNILSLNGKLSNVVIKEDGIIGTTRYGDDFIPSLKEVLDNNSDFPISEILSPYLEIAEDMPFDTAYYGKLAVKYRVIDELYSNAAFTDVINFKLEVEKPVTIENGLFNNMVLDNAGMIKLANELNPNREWTQELLAKEKETHIRLTLILIIILLVMVIILIRTFIIKKKQFNLHNLVFFYKN